MRPVVLVLPGGADRSTLPYHRLAPQALRMYPFTASIAATFRDRVVVAQARYDVVGWNRDQASPLAPARRQFDALREQHPDSPVLLIGHSMGGRVASHLAADPAVSGVLAFAPWWETGSTRRIHAGTRVVAIHGTADTMTSAASTQRAVTALQARGVDATFYPVADGGHAMLDHIPLWQKAALRFVSRFVDDDASPS